jgi:glycosyltransferase involved in cell wall biosynthesis
MKRSGTVGRTPVVSVVTPAYNAARFLPETVDSVLAQTLADFELILVDDGSTDDTLAVARRQATRDERVRVLSMPNGGPAAARNMALRAARGEFLALLDSDDLICPQYLATQIGVLDAHPEASIVTANAINRGGGANFDGKPYWPRTTGVQRLTTCDVIGQEDAVCILSVFRRRVYDTIGGFNPVFSGNEDYEFWLRAAVAGFVILRNHETLGFYRRHEGSLSSNELRMIRGVLNVLRHARSMLEDPSPEADVLQRQIARFTRELPRAELRSSLQRSDAAAISRVLRTLAAERGGMLAACARLTSRWPLPLLWAYRLRGRVRNRMTARRRSIA